MTIKELICYLKAIPLWCRSREWAPHTWIEKETYPRQQIWVSENGFRVKDESLNHYPGERLVQNVTLHGHVCKYCGKKMMDWDRGYVVTLPKE